MRLPSFKASYKILKAKKLLVEVFSGTMTLDAFKSYKLKQSQDVDFLPTYDFFVDMQDVVVDGTLDHVREYVKFVISNGYIIGKRKSATMINTHNQKVYAELFRNLHEVDTLPQDFRIFTDFDLAIDWLQKDITKEEIQALFKELKQKPQFVWYADKDY